LPRRPQLQVQAAAVQVLQQALVVAEAVPQQVSPALQQAEPEEAAAEAEQQQVRVAAASEAQAVEASLPVVEA